jgi:hypothetical protein
MLGHHETPFFVQPDTAWLEFLWGWQDLCVLSAAMIVAQYQLRHQNPNAILKPDTCDLERASHTMPTLEGILERITYHSEQDGYTVAIAGLDEAFDSKDSWRGTQRALLLAIALAR